MCERERERERERKQKVINLKLLERVYIYTSQHLVSSLQIHILIPSHGETKISQQRPYHQPSQQIPRSPYRFQQSHSTSWRRMESSHLHNMYYNSLFLFISFSISNPLLLLKTESIYFLFIFFFS